MCEQHGDAEDGDAGGGARRRAEGAIEQGEEAATRHEHDDQAGAKTDPCREVHLRGTSCGGHAIEAPC